MSEIELLKAWPSWAKANAETILASPAWRVPFMGGNLRVAEAPAADLLVALTVAFDDEEAELKIYDSPAFPELHELKPVLNRFPAEIRLALAEKECGGLFQALEDLARRQLSIRRIVDSSIPRFSEPNSRISESPNRLIP